MAQIFFDTSKANELAKFQGQFAGIQAGNSTVCGTAMAPTSIYNQAGYYAIQDTDTGYVNLQKLGGESLYTQQWYDQGTGTIFDFSPNGQGVVSTNTNTNSTTTTTNSATNIYNNYNSSNATTNSSGTQNSTTNSNLQQYPWGTGYVAVQPNNGVTTTINPNGTQTKVDENGDPIELTAADIQELVDAGIYDSAEEALNATLGQGYTVSDAEQAKLGIYSADDEAKIQLYMEKYGCTRDEAIRNLGSKVNPEDTTSEIEAKFNDLMDKGFTREEAVEYMEALGYDVPDELKVEPDVYSEEDEAKINALMQTTGCSREEAIKAIGCKPKTEKLGLLRSIGKGIGDFFSGIGKGISDAWNSFVDWIW